MSFVIRKGQKEDVPSILNLIKELAIFEEQPKAVVLNAEDLLRDGFSKRPKFMFFVAQQGGKIIGMALFYERYSTWKGATIHLEDLIVTKNKRNLGIGKALYTKVLQFAFDNNFSRVAWEVLDWNTNAINFYKSAGATILKDWSVVQMDKKSLKKFIKNKK